MPPDTCYIDGADLLDLDLRLRGEPGLGPVGREANLKRIHLAVLEVIGATVTTPRPSRYCRWLAPSLLTTTRV